MKKYTVSICYTQMEKIEVSANSIKEAEEIVNRGYYEIGDIVDSDTDDFQIIDCKEVIHE